MAVNVSFRDAAIGEVTNQATGGNAALITNVIKYAGTVTTLGGVGATQAVSLPGVAATDTVIATLLTTGSTPRLLLTAAASLNTVTFVFSGDPNTGTAHVVSYMVVREP
jgi:hypothetical protein